MLGVVITLFRGIVLLGVQCCSYRSTVTVALKESRRRPKYSEDLLCDVVWGV